MADTKTHGDPCVRCGETLRWTASGRCVECQRRYQRERYRNRYRNDPEFRERENARWRDYYYERMPPLVRQAWLLRHSMYVRAAQREAAVSRLRDTQAEFVEMGKEIGIDLSRPLASEADFTERHLRKAEETRAKAAKIKPPDDAYLPRGGRIGERAGEQRANDDQKPLDEAA